MEGIGKRLKVGRKRWKVWEEIKGGQKEMEGIGKRLKMAKMRGKVWERD